MTRIACLAAVLLVFPATGTAQKGDGFDPGKIVGEWTYVSGVRAGEMVPKDHLGGKVTFTKDAITVPAGPDAKFLMAYKVDPKAKPAAIDMDIKDGPVKEGKALGIIAIEGDEMKLCYVNVPKDKADTKRPTKFESTKENEAFLFVLKRAK
jgi:uncharacterized protein (TIGR03067 family)